MIKVLASAGILAVAVTLAAGSAQAINHTTDYETNIQNYRYCDADPLGSCRYEDVISPSAYYLEDGKTITVVYADDGDVGLKIDAGTIKMDTDVTHACSDQQFECSVPAPFSGTCSNAPSPKQTTVCNGTGTYRCDGGIYDGQVCTSSSQCTGGECVHAAACIFKACQSGPQVGKFCGTGGGGVSCTSTNNQTGFKLRIIGNETGAEVDFGFAYYLLRGNGETGGGCIMECPVNLGSDGSVNTADLANCTMSGDCLNSPIEAIHSVQLIDPDGKILGIPGVGPNVIFNSAQQADPAKAGDCVRVPTNGPCS